MCFGAYSELQLVSENETDDDFLLSLDLLSVAVDVAPAPFQRSRVISVLPRYLLLNRTPCVICVCPASVVSEDSNFTLAPNMDSPMHWSDWDGSREIVIRIQSPDSVRSPPGVWSQPVSLIGLEGVETPIRIPSLLTSCGTILQLLGQAIESMPGTTCVTIRAVISLSTLQDDCVKSSQPDWLAMAADSAINSTNCGMRSHSMRSASLRKSQVGILHAPLNSFHGSQLNFVDEVVTKIEDSAVNARPSLRRSSSRSDLSTPSSLRRSFSSSRLLGIRQSIIATPEYIMSELVTPLVALQNKTQVIIWYRQQATSKRTEMEWFELLPGACHVFGWTRPSAPKILELRFGSEESLNKNNMWCGHLFKLKVGQKLVLFKCGTTRARFKVRQNG